MKEGEEEEKTEKRNIRKLLHMNLFTSSSKITS